MGRHIIALVLMLGTFGPGCDNGGSDDQSTGNLSPENRQCMDEYMCLTDNCGNLHNQYVNCFERHDDGDGIPPECVEWAEPYFECLGDCLERPDSTEEEPNPPLLKFEGCQNIEEGRATYPGGLERWEDNCETLCEG